MEIEKQITEAEVSPDHVCNSYCFPESGLNPELVSLEKSEVIFGENSQNS